VAEQPRDPQSWGWVSQTDSRPVTPIQALMEAGIGDTPERSLVELQVLREAVVDCFDQLDEQSKFVLEAWFFERITIRQLAVRLGLKKSRTHRIKNEALEKLEVLLLQHPLIGELYG
jgi:RNA polymerase sigma factor (sigma-70 family)